MRPINDCFETGGSYADCVSASAYMPNDRWAIPINYDPNSENNPNVVGGTAWRALHPEAAAQLDSQSQGVHTPAAIIQRTNQGTQQPPSVASTGSGIPGWLIGVLVIGVIAVAAGRQ